MPAFKGLNTEESEIAAPAGHAGFVARRAKPRAAHRTLTSCCCPCCCPCLPWVQTAAANEQHYELPTEYFLAALGPHRKYSSCLYERPDMTLAEAEEAMLELCCARAQLEDGQEVRGHPGDDPGRHRAGWYWRARAGAAGRCMVCGPLAAVRLARLASLVGPKCCPQLRTLVACVARKYSPRSS